MELTREQIELHRKFIGIAATCSPDFERALCDLALRGLESYDKPCPYVTTSREGTSYCQLAAQYDPAAIVRAALEAVIPRVQDVAERRACSVPFGGAGVARQVGIDVASAIRALSTDEGVEKILKGVKS